MTTMTTRPAIIGVGNVLMGDDGVGPAALEVFGAQGLGDRAELIDAGLAFSEVLCDLEPDRRLIIVDAVRGGGPAGSVYRLTLADLEAGAGMVSAMSLHEVNVLPALQMEALAGREFTDVTIFGVEPGRVDWGEGLSAPVAAAVEKLAEILAQYVNSRADAACGSTSQ